MWCRASVLGLVVGGALLHAASAEKTQCNPLDKNVRCQANNTALGMSIDVDFRKGSVNSFVAAGRTTYGRDGAEFSVKASGDAPQISSVFYIMFGYVEVTLQAARGAGIVSSLVLLSDDGDEVDLEWLGSNATEVQSNYFGKGRATDHSGRFHAVNDTQSQFVTYAVDWTQDAIRWFANGTRLRELHAADAAPDQFPQTPMRVKTGAWAGGDPTRNEKGTVEWARGPTDFAAGPFNMSVERLRVIDYSTGHEYYYRSQSGAWTDIGAVGGAVNGNKNARPRLDGGPAPPASAADDDSRRPGPVPPGGIARDGSPATRTQTGWPWVAGARPTGGNIPAGWHMTSEGKIMRDSTGSSASPAARPPPPPSLPLLLLLLPPLLVPLLLPPLA